MLKKNLYNTYCVFWCYNAYLLCNFTGHPFTLHSNLPSQDLGHSFRAPLRFFLNKSMVSDCSTFPWSAFIHQQLFLKINLAWLWYDIFFSTISVHDLSAFCQHFHSDQKNLQSATLQLSQILKQSTTAHNNFNDIYDRWFYICINRDYLI